MQDGVGTLTMMLQPLVESLWRIGSTVTTAYKMVGILELSTSSITRRSRIGFWRKRGSGHSPNKSSKHGRTRVNTASCGCTGFVSYPPRFYHIFESCLSISEACGGRGEDKAHASYLDAPSTLGMSRQDRLEVNGRSASRVGTAANTNLLLISTVLEAS